MNATDDATLPVRYRIIECRNCELHKSCTLPIPFRGSAEPKIVVMGHAPSEQDDAASDLFTDPAGQYLKRSLTAAGFDLDELAFMNTVACFPRDLLDHPHVDACQSNRDDMLAELNPKWVLLLGPVALKSFKPWLAVKHGGRPMLDGGRVLWATQHPATVQRSANENIERQFIDDILRFKEMVDAGDHRPFLPDECACCGNAAEWWTADALGYCSTHIPEGARAQYVRQQELIQSDYDRAKRSASTVWREVAGLKN